MRRLAWLSVLPVLVAACSSERSGAGLMLTMRTDLRVPDHVDVVGVYIARLDGGALEVISNTEVQAEYTEGDGGKRVVLPGTLAIQSDDNPDTRIRVRVVAYDASRKPVAMREARLNVPVDDLKALPMPLLWLNTDDVADADPAGALPKPVAGDAKAVGTDTGGVDAFARFESDFCGVDRTLDDTGACADIEIPLDRLETFQPTAFDPRRGVVGAGAAEPAGELGGDGARSHDFCPAGTARECFETIGCFPSDDESDPNFVTLEVRPDSFTGDGTSCSVSLASIAAGVPGGMNVTEVALAVKTSAKEGATCIGAGDCFIPLDTNAGARVDVAAQRITLPPGVCRKAKKNGTSIVSIVASPICKPKQVDDPICVTEDGAAARGSCRDGSGWNGQQDPPPVLPDGGPDAADGCARVPDGSGFWVDTQHVTVIATTGDLFVYPRAALAAGCLKGAPELRFDNGNAHLPSAQQYRLFGPSFDEPSLLAYASSSSEERGTGVVYTTQDGGTYLSPFGPLDTGVTSAGAFLDGYTTQGPTAFFLSQAGEGTAAHGNLTDSFSAVGFDVGSNLAAVRAGNAGTFFELAKQGNDLFFVRCDTEITLGPPTCAHLDLSPAVAGYEPIATAARTSSVAYGLAVAGLSASVLTFTPAASQNVATVTSDIDGGIPATMTLALTNSVTQRAYFASFNALYRVDLDEGRLVGPLAQGSGFLAVQIVGSELFTLERDSGGAAVRARALDEDGILR